MRAGDDRARHHESLSRGASAIVSAASSASRCATSASRPSAVAERLDIAVDRVRAELVVGVAGEQLLAEQAEQPRRRQVARERQHRAQQSHLARRPPVVRHRRHEAESRDALRPARCHRLRDAAAEVVPDDARVVDAEHVEQLDDAFGVRAERERAHRGPVAAAVAEQVDDHDAVSVGEKRHHLRPEVRRGRESRGAARSARPPRAFPPRSSTVARRRGRRTRRARGQPGVRSRRFTR